MTRSSRLLLLQVLLSLSAISCEKSRPCLTQGALRELDCECPEGMHIGFKPGSKTESFCVADDAGQSDDGTSSEKRDASLARADAASDASAREDADSGAEAAQPEDAEGDSAAPNSTTTDSAAASDGGGADANGATPEPCSATNECTNKLGLGAACSEDRECGSGHCTDGVCCDSADCVGSCRACNVPGKGLGTCTKYDDSDSTLTNDAPAGTCPGTCMACDGSSNDCVNVPAGADWKNVCNTMLESTCGTTGACDGSGKCQLHGRETSCDDGQHCNGVDKCDGAGQCSHAGDPCSGMVCGACDEASNSCRNTETWYDSTSDLTWEIAASPTLLTWEEAVLYCAGRSHCGNDHWRLPSISELRQQTRGCESTSNFINGDCVINNTLAFEGFVGGCHGCDASAGPAPGGCFRPKELEGPCGHYWTSTPSLDPDGNGTGNAWVIFFGNAKLEFFPQTTPVRVRCVRSGM